MGESSTSQDAIEVDLKDEDTENNLAFIDKLHSFGISSLVNLPQLVVMGDQSSGKSSVLQAITRLPFPFGDKICTRFATEVSLRRSPGPISISICIRIAQDDTQQFTEEHRRRIYEWNSQKSNRTNVLDAQEFTNILREAGDTILGVHNSGNILSNATLHITQKGPQETNLTIVDLPGLTSVRNDAHETALTLLQRYIDNPRSIILAVVCPFDTATQNAYEMIKDIPDKEKRVVGVINKCDRKQDASDGWVFEHIRNKKGNSHYLSQGWFGLRNRQPTEKDISDDQRDQNEAEFFRQRVWADLNQPTRLGISHLKTKLKKMLNELIVRSIPIIIPEIREKIAECKSELGRLGHARSTKVEQLNCMMTLATDFSRLSADALNGRYETLPPKPEAKIRKIYQDILVELQLNMNDDHAEFFGFDDDYQILQSLEPSQWEGNILENELYREIHDVILENRGMEFPEKVNNPCVLNILWSNKTSSWNLKATALIDSFRESAILAMSLFFDTVCLDEDLRRNARKWLSECLPGAVKSAEEELAKIIADEAKAIWTVNHQRFACLKTLQNNRIKKMTQELMTLSSYQPEQAAHAESKIKSWLETHGTIAAVFETFDNLASYYEIAMNRFIDNDGLQVIERHLLGPSSPLQIFTAQYVVQESDKDDTLLERIAGENVAKRNLRETWNRKKENLERMLQTAEEYGFLGH